MMTKKTMAIVSVFMVVAMTAVGFAAWLIVGTIDGDAQGSFVSNELQDKYFKVEVEFAKTGENDPNGNIIFGTPTTGSSQLGDWLTYSDEDEKENLTATATIKFTPEAGFDATKTMDYYLLQSENEDGTKTYRTVRVMIDIAEVLTGDTQTDNYKWFDMAVQLGYIQYPTANLLKADSSRQALTWGKEVTGEDGVTGVTALGEDETANFQNNFLYLDLTYDMFSVDTSNEFATAEIEITFNWGTAVSETVDGEEEPTYYNPYTFFADKDPEDTVDVLKYLKVDNGEYSVADTADVAEGDQNPDDDKTIRYKDLAERMLSYLSERLNYVAADENGANGSGIQFSITLTEGALHTPTTTDENA